MRTSALLFLASILLLPVNALGQDTRSEEIAAKQKEKATKLAPYVPTGFERIMGRLEEGFVSPPSGWYPAFGSIYPGGGLSLGAGYRHFDRREAVWDVHGLYSIKAYKNIEFGTRGPWHLRDRFGYDAKVGWLDAPQVAFYGIGPGGGTRANYHLSQTYASFAGLLRPTWWTRLRGEVGYDAFDTKEGRGRHPSIETLYDGFSAPGLASSPSFIRAEGTAAIDWRTSPSYSAKGGYYGVTLVNFSDTGDTEFSFKRLDAELIQHLPLLRGNWVFSVRGRVQTILDDEDFVPYFLLPQLGSGSTIRGYPTGFFRDRHSILTSAEFRWIPNRLALDMAVFYDAGKVTRDRADLDLSNLESSWGVGARFHTPTSMVLRIEAARPKNGKWRLIVSTGAAF